MTRSIETRHGTQNVEVTTLKRRTPADAQPVYKPLRDKPLDSFDLVERVKHLGEMARRLEAHRSPEQFAIDKNELQRSIGRLEADLRRKGVG